MTVLVNHNPVAVDDSFAVNEDSGTITLDVLTNDTDEDNVPPAASNAGLTVTAVTTPTNGTAVINANSTVTYTPSPGFSGADSFIYTVSDGVGTATATVAVTVNADAGAVDLDISALRVPSNVRINGTVTPRLDVRNNGTVNGSRPATVVGVKNNVQVYNETVQVSDAPGGKVTSFNFPASSAITTAGTITWTATIADDNPDVDQATATTRVR